MKKSEIKIGEDYAFSLTEYGSMTRVRIIEESSVDRGWGHNRKSRFAWKVQRLNDDGTPQRRTPSDAEDWFLHVESRTIRQPWAEYAEEQRKRQQERRSAAAKLQADRIRRAGEVADLIPRLEASGLFEVNDSWVLYDDAVAAIVRANVSLQGRIGPGKYSIFEALHAPLARGLLEYIKSGAKVEIPFEALVALCAERP